MVVPFGRRERGPSHEQKHRLDRDRSLRVLPGCWFGRRCMDAVSVPGRTRVCRPIQPGRLRFSGVPGVRADKTRHIHGRSYCIASCPQPHYGQSGWEHGAGVSLEVFIDGESCDGPREDLIEAPIEDGSRLLQVDVVCGAKSLAPGQHIVRVQAAALGNCLPLRHLPKTCNTRRIRGAYAVVE